MGRCTALAFLWFFIAKGWERRGGWCTALADSAWQLLQLPVENPWSMPGGPFVCFLAQTGIEPFTSSGLNIWHFRQLLGSF